jgi:hypothetical protein
MDLPSPRVRADGNDLATRWAVAAEKLIQTVNSPPVGYAFG